MPHSLKVCHQKRQIFLGCLPSPLSVTVSIRTIRTNVQMDNVFVDPTKNCVDPQKSISLETLAAYSFCKLAIVQIDNIIVNANNCKNCVDPKMHLSRDPCCTTTVCAVVDSYTTPTNEDYHIPNRKKEISTRKMLLVRDT